MPQPTETPTNTYLNRVAITRARGVAWATVDADCPGSAPEQAIQAIVTLRTLGTEHERVLAASALQVLNKHRAATCPMCSPFEGVTA